MLTLNPPVGTPMLPKREPNIPLELFTFKQATGFLLWNGQTGNSAKFYLMKFIRQDVATPVARFFGGTAIPFPYSLRSTGVQSLIRLAEHFDIDLPEDAGEGFVPLHHFMKTETSVSEVVDDPNALKVRIPVMETHGLLPAEEAFIAAYRDKLVEVVLERNLLMEDPLMPPAFSLKTEDNLPFNNQGMIEILCHLISEGKQPEEMRRVAAVIEPEWSVGNYTVAYNR